MGSGSMRSRVASVVPSACGLNKDTCSWKGVCGDTALRRRDVRRTSRFRVYNVSARLSLSAGRPIGCYHRHIARGLISPPAFGSRIPYAALMWPIGGSANPSVNVAAVFPPPRHCTALPGWRSLDRGVTPLLAAVFIHLSQNLASVRNARRPCVRQTSCARGSTEVDSFSLSPNGPWMRDSESNPDRDCSWLRSLAFLMPEHRQGM